MNNALEAKFTSAFSRDLKKKMKKQMWDLQKLEEVIDLVVANTPTANDKLSTCAFNKIHQYQLTNYTIFN